jgi:hypothetical protein
MFYSREEEIMTHIKPVDRVTDVKEVLEEGLKFADQMDGVIVLGLHKDGSSLMRSSNMSMYEKMFLKAFFESWASSWFNLKNN